MTVSHQLLAALRAGLTAVLIIGLMSACGTGDQISADLNAAATKLQSQSNAWQDTLINLESQLRKDGSNLVDKVDQLLRTSVQMVSIETRCTSDFIGQRVHDTLYNFLADRLHRPHIPVRSQVCATNPFGDLQLEKVRDGTVHQLVLDGYNLSGLRISVVAADGSATAVAQEYLSSPDKKAGYEWVLNLSQANGLKLPDGTQKLRFLAQGDVIGDMNVEGVPASTPPPPPVLVGPISIWFHTNDDDKNADTALTVVVEDRGGLLLASWAPPGQPLLHDNTDYGPFQLTPATVPLDRLHGADVQICIAPKGSDVWRFNYVISAPISTGGMIEVAENSVQLSQNGLCHPHGMG